MRRLGWFRREMADRWGELRQTFNLFRWWRGR
jgi:hypothetical protein